jgi:hypothetical protein
MAAPPLINLPDGSGQTTDLIITSNLIGFIFTGSVASNTVDVQININSAGFISDPTLVSLTLPTFTIPNLNSLPQGIILQKGPNLIQLRTVDITGALSSPSTISINVVTENDLQIIPIPPTGIRVQRHANTIELQWTVASSVDPVGFNVYASTGEGGTDSGYLRVNKEMISFGLPKFEEREETPIDDVTFDFSNPNGDDFKISTQLIDPATNALSSQTSLNVYPLIQSQNFRFSFKVSSLIINKFFSFEHSRTATALSGFLNSDTFSLLTNDTPLFYVVTAVYFDKTTGDYSESRFSNEVASFPLALDTTVRGLRIRDRRIVAQDFIREVAQAQPQLSLIPGSTIREIHIEPFSNEIQKAYFLMDFIHRAKSFAALLQIDDPNLTGISIDVPKSAYKQNLKTALGIESDDLTQQIIDFAFDALARNFNVTRAGPRRAIVTQTFFTSTRPTADMIVQQGAVIVSSQNANFPRFVTQGQVGIPFDDVDSFFNPNTRRYEIKVQAIAETPGAIGNVPAGALDTVSSGAPGFQTTNEVAATFGLDFQSNLELAEVSTRVLSSLDTGTEGGYELISIGTPNVLEAKAVKSGDRLMMRDYDPVRKKHIGGKVDIYIKGVVERIVTETFAFRFDTAKNIRFDVIDPLNFIFRARDSRLTIDNPIQEMLFNTAQGLGLRNHSVLPTGIYDLTGVTIIDFQTIQLNSLISQPATFLDDFVEGDYRFRSGNKFIASLQPIIRVGSVVGEVSGTLDSDDGFSLFKTEDPLLEGESTKASDFVAINQVNGVPAGNTISVNDEQHVLIGEYQERLNSVGINESTIVVFNADRTVTFNGPMTLSPDYLIISGTQTEPASIVRTTTSTIVSGATVSVDYEHDENFQITYVINDVLQTVQQRIDKTKHITADVIVKQTISNPISMEATIQLFSNADRSLTDSRVRTAITNLTNIRGIGEPIHLSDVIAVMDNTIGVDFIEQPFNKFTLADGALQVREAIPSSFVELSSLSQFTNVVYILTEPLNFATVDNGGNEFIHHGVYMDDVIMTFSETLSQIGSAVNQAFIIGNQGAVITGYSDDATLTPLFVTPELVAEERLKRTANHIVISLDASRIPFDNPKNHSFAATYAVQGDKGAKNIDITETTFLAVGDITLTFRSSDIRVFSS